MLTQPTKMTPPSLADLTARFLARPAANDAEAGVEPHEVIAGFATDSRTTWTEAVAAAKLLGLKDVPTNSPTDWVGYSRQAASADFLPLALGHFPQQVREITSLLGTTKKAHTTESRGWNVISGKATAVSLMLNAASARVTGNVAEAERLLTEAAPLCQGDAAQATLQNEKAALLWQKGDRTAAVAIWKQQPESGVAAFNLGVAFLVTSQKAEAQAQLKTAIAKLPETSGWHHLAQLYLALS